MRALFILLLLANLALAGYAWHSSRQTNPDAGLLHLQMNADKIRITAPRPMVAPARPKAACLEWGTFGAGEARVAQAAAEGLKLGDRLTSREVQVLVSYWVYIPPLKTKAEADRKIAELKSLGVQEYYMVEGPSSMRNAISLGIFKTEDAATNYLAALSQRGVRSARVGSRDHRVNQVTFLIREPDVALTAKLAELRLQFPGSELKAVDCPP